MIKKQNVIGAVDRCDEKGLSGWARYEKNQDIVLFELHINDIKVAIIKCNAFRSDLKEIRDDGCFAFKLMFDPQALSLLPTSTRIKLVFLNTSEPFFKGEITGKGGDIEFNGQNAQNQTLSLNKNGRLIVLLGDRGDAYLDGLLEFVKGILDTLNNPLGFHSFISYGTLLGAIRHSDVIAHDDDIDIALFIPSKKPEDIEYGVASIIEHFVKMGFRINKFSPTQFHIAKGNYWVDIFVCWTIDNDFYMTWAINGEIDKTTVFPLKKVNIRNQNLFAPHHSERFLEVLYGKNWQVPDPHFNWKNRDVWGKLPENYKYLAESIEKTTRYWDSYYTQAKTIPKWPSQFACFVLDEVHSANINSPTIIDIGCGNARDSLFFAENNYATIGLDGSKEVVKINNAKNVNNSTFYHCNFNDYSSVSNMLNRLNSLTNDKDIVIYCRFFVHAIDVHAENLLIMLCAGLVTKCKLLAFEFRIQGDNEGMKETSHHYRRYQNHLNFIAKLEKYNFRKVYEITGKGYAKYKRDDALICRLLFV